MIVNGRPSRRQMLGMLAAGANARAATPDRPNILFIYTDDHSHRTISCVQGSLSVGADARDRSSGDAGRPLHGRL